MAPGNEKTEAQKRKQDASWHPAGKQKIVVR